ncbi:phosphatase PAP2 family protein, partial [Patescibacteria group bacterium]|nr:phosphatase PAP2 family protein [Patescibacteria group bacterium]
ILQLDQQLFSVIYSAPHPYLLDWVMTILTLVGIGGGIWIVILGYFAFRDKNLKRFLAILLSLTTIFLYTEVLLKPLVARPRPITDYTHLQLNLHVVPITDYSFPSGHAAGSFAMAIILSAIKNRWRPLFFTLAALIGFSRIYLGCHHPLDVITGGIIGLIHGIITISILKYKNLLTTQASS